MEKLSIRSRTVRAAKNTVTISKSKKEALDVFIPKR